MAHKVRIELPADCRGEVEKAVWMALESCPEEECWEVVVLQDVRAPGQWEAVAGGPKVEAGGEWEVLAAAGRWSRSHETLYTRLFEGSAEQEPDYIRQSFEELFRCFERAST